MATEDMRERLAQLPHHAVVAFAARCARRVQPLTHALPQQGRDAIDRTLVSAEAFAKGTADAAARADAARADAEAAVAAQAAVAARAGAEAAWADAADVARADAAGAAAAWAAAALVARADAADEAAAWAAAASDLERLIALKRGEPDTLGAPIDPSESGPLGPLWPQGMPEWYTQAATGTVTPHEEPSGDAD